ncbi:hypothetical protein GCM10009839_44950 [Catenulispora yoronensis]|uniref:Uncharacterized protein n=1 Tax=Catenulispora yoronensis TaxID=450799 RepID=A0ABN2UKG0_9ACTN
MPTTTKFDYDGIRFRAEDHPTTAPHAAAGTPTIGHYHQNGDLVWAEFGGGRLRTGRLVGTTRPDGTIDAAYCQLALDGTMVAGTVVSTPERLPDGRIRLVEDWRRADGSTGVSVIEECRGVEDGGGNGSGGDRGSGDANGSGGSGGGYGSGGARGSDSARRSGSVAVPERGGAGTDQHGPFAAHGESAG